MRRPCPIPVLPALALLLLPACWGGFDQGPILPGQGAIEGRFPEGADPERAWVAVVGEPTLVATVDSSGAFRIDGIDAGRVALAGVDGRGGAFYEASRRVWNGRVTRVEPQVVDDVEVGGEVRVPGAAHAPVTISVQEVPVLLGADGSFDIEHLPPLCMTFEFERTGYETATRRVCPAPGDTVRLEVSLDATEPEAAGLCAPCRSDGECETGLCALHEVEDVSEQVCARPCEDDAECPAGYECQKLGSGETRQACLPRRASCLALEDYLDSRVCQADEACGLPGADDGVCREGRCTVLCEDDSECPASTHCVIPGDGKGVCR
ncbi:MAG: carboxypeptidase regulatory-like domain-containing protein [Deltaproteobacteria bacterium]|nr:MAG: carboxypeptidase regulatory-like domain-containing protein [Deltaproteobacteria bacterium]